MKGPRRAHHPSRGRFARLGSPFVILLALASCQDGSTASPTTTNIQTTTTTMAPPDGTVEAVTATMTALVDAHRAGRDTDATAYFTDAALRVCPSRTAFAEALKGVRDITSLVYKFAGVGPGYTEDDGVGTFEIELIELKPALNQPYQTDPITAKVALVPGPDGWLVDQAFPPIVPSFC